MEHWLTQIGEGGSGTLGNKEEQVNEGVEHWLTRGGERYGLREWNTV